MQNWIQRTIGLTILPLALYGAAYAQASAGAVVMRTAQAANENPFAAGKTAAQALKTAMGAAEIKGVFYAECFEDKANKEAVLKGIESVLGAGKVAGGAVYGSYTQGGVLTEDAVALLGIGGEGVSVTMALEETLGAAGLTIEKDKDKLTQALGTAGNRLAKKLGNTGDASLLILLGDAHSPKNQLLLDGVQAVVGKKLPITGGSLNKNSGQNWLGFNGKLYTDAAVAMLVRSKSKVAQTGRKAKENDLVISTAKEGATEAIRKLGTAPDTLLAFDCAGRKGKLKNIADELAAIQSAVGKTTTLFGCYCAGEFGPADTGDVANKTTVYGRGWHVMFSALAQP